MATVRLHALVRGVAFYPLFFLPALLAQSTTRLRIEYLNNPLTIDVVTPRFSPIRFCVDFSVSTYFHWLITLIQNWFIHDDYSTILFKLCLHCHYFHIGSQVHRDMSVSLIFSRFSWALEHTTRGAQQHAYSIVVQVTSGICVTHHWCLSVDVKHLMFSSFSRADLTFYRRACAYLGHGSSDCQHFIKYSIRRPDTGQRHGLRLDDHLVGYHRQFGSSGDRFIFYLSLRCLCLEIGTMADRAKSYFR